MLHRLIRNSALFLVFVVVACESSNVQVSTEGVPYELVKFSVSPKKISVSQGSHVQVLLHKENETEKSFIKATVANAPFISVLNSVDVGDRFRMTSGEYAKYSSIELQSAITKEFLDAWRNSFLNKADFTFDEKEDVPILFQVHDPFVFKGMLIEKGKFAIRDYPRRGLVKFDLEEKTLDEKYIISSEKALGTLELDVNKDSQGGYALMTLLKHLRAGNVYKVLVPVTLSEVDQKAVKKGERYVWYEIEIVE